MANTVYANMVVEAKLNDLLNTQMNTRNFMTIDDSLAESAGMTKKINRYSYTGAVEKLAKGAKNTVRGAVTFTPASYDVEVAQQVFDYHDEEFMSDAKVVDMGLKGGSQLMVNDMNTKFFAELAKTSTVHTTAVKDIFGYDDVVDAIALMNIENESGLFLVIGTDLKAMLRKDADFKSAQQGEIIFNGQIGNIAGIPVVVSKLCPDNTAYLATNEAVTLFTKKDSEVEQERDAEARKNTIIMRKVNLVALTDSTKAVKIAVKTV